MAAPVAAQRSLQPGVWAPLITTFASDESLDLDAFAKQVVRVGSAGVGLVVNGSTAEAVSLTRSERTILVKTARETLDAANLSTITIIAGVGVGSTRESIELACDAHAAGADAVIALPPAFYRAQLEKDQAALLAYFTDIAAASPLPVIAYSFPAVGIDLSSDLLIKLARNSPNCCGCKFTCANVGKMARVAAITASPSFDQSHPRASSRVPFLVLSGYSDILLQTLIMHGSGTITGLANVTPRVIKLLFDESVHAIQMGDPETMRRAQKLQDLVSQADGDLAAHGLTGTKWAVHHWFGGHGSGVPRRPLPPLTAEAAQKVKYALAEIVAMESELMK